METIRVLFLPASGAGVGGGHVLRCLALAWALRERGAVCGFAVEAEGARLLERFDAGGSMERVVRSGDLARIADAWRADVVVVDDYGLDAAGEIGLPTPTRRLIAIDDLANRPRRADVLIDPSYGRSAADYATLTTGGATLLLGPAYALLRPDFADAAPITIQQTVERVFVGFGLADPGGITLRAVAALLPALPGVAFDVVIGASAESLPGLRALAAREPRLHVHVETDRAAALMAGADLAIGAGGSSTWERFRLGLPSLCVVVADNQRALTHDLTAEGLHVALEAGGHDFDDRLVAAAHALAGNEAERRRMSQAGRGITDGQGARRAADAILAVVKTPA